MSFLNQTKLEQTKFCSDMAGKKKKKGKKKKEEPEPEDEFFTMRGEQLEITIQNLREKLSNSKMQRNTL